MGEILKSGRGIEEATNYPELEPKNLSVFIENNPLNSLQEEVVSGLRNVMKAQGADIQTAPDISTNLVVTCAEMFEDVPYKETTLYKLPTDVDRFQTKVVSVSSISRVPEFEEIDAEYLRALLGVDGYKKDHRQVINMARDRFHSPMLTIGYPQLPLVGCSLALIVVGNEDSHIPEGATLIGLEQSYPQVAGSHFYEEAYTLITAQAMANLVIKNRIIEDNVVPQSVWEETYSLERERVAGAGVKMRDLGMLPPPFPMKNILSDEKLRFYRRMLNLTGLSYGNASERARGEAARYGKFFMSLSGVQKDAMTQDKIRLVTGLIPDTLIMGIAGIEEVEQLDSERVSVDAIEVELLYDAFPSVGVTTHGHVWLKDPFTGQPIGRFKGYRKFGGLYVVCTDIQYPCGSFELGVQAATAGNSSPDPSKTIILERRHGIVGLGPDFDELFGNLQELKEADYLTPHIPQT